MKGREIYGAYLLRAEGISRKLFNLKAKVEAMDRTLTIQRLAALTQDLSLENATFRDSFQHGEESFYSYQLIERAVESLEDAVTYWRAAAHFRPLYRGTRLNRLEDDEILKIRLQRAMIAIEELKILERLRQKISEDVYRRP